MSFHCELIRHQNVVSHLAPLSAALTVVSYLLCSKLVYELSLELIKEFKHATFLRRGRQPEINISHARAVVSPRFLT